MKKAIYLIIALIGLSAPSCSDSMLDFSPTDSGSGKELLKSASTAITSVNGVYRSMWTAGWSTTANTHQCFGIAAYNLALDCMADDLIMQSQGNGWFWGDHCYNVKSNYTSSAFRSYDVWYANYKWIANVNYIIDAEPEMAGTEADVAYVAGQAYAIRALCYLNLGDVVLPRPLQLPDGRFALERALRTGLHHRHVDRHGRTAPRIAAHGLRPYRPGHRPCHRTARKGQGNHAGRE